MVLACASPLGANTLHFVLFSVSFWDIFAWSHLHVPIVPIKTELCTTNLNTHDPLKEY